MKEVGIKFIDKNFKVIFSILIALIVVLFCASFVLARYSDKISKTGTLSVAKYSLNETGTLDLGMISPGEKLTYNFEVSNKEDEKISEVAQHYNIKITTTNNLPLIYTLTGTNTTNTGSLASNLDETTLITSTPGVLPHTKNTTHSYVLTVEWPSDKTESMYLNEVDKVSLNIEAVQKN